MKNKTWIINRRFLIVLLALLILILVFFVNVKAGTPYVNCTQVYVATGRSNIPKSDKLYNPAMDRNHNGISCE